MGPLVKWAALSRDTPLKLETPYQGQSLIKVNPLYHKHVYFRFPDKRLHIQFNNLTTSKTIGETQNKRNDQRGQGNNYQTTERKPTHNKQTNTFGPMSILGDIGPKVVFLSLLLLLLIFVCLVFSMVVDSCCLDLFGCFGFFGFPDVFPNEHLIPRKGSDVDAPLC